MGDFAHTAMASPSPTGWAPTRDPTKAKPMARGLFVGAHPCGRFRAYRHGTPVAYGVGACKSSRSDHFFKHSDMKALRSSPFLPAASALHVFILFCCFSCLLALRQSFMKALRSSPFLPSASLLQVAILLC